MSVRGALRRRTLGGAIAGLAAAVLMLGGVPAHAEEPTDETGTIAGSVTSESDGQPVEGVYVEATNEDGTNSAGATTDANGVYVLDGLLAGEFLVQFRGSGDLLGEYWKDSVDWWGAERVSVAQGQDVAGIDAALAVGGSISGTVVREEDGTPVAGVAVSASGANGSWAYTETDGEGDYTLPALPADAYVVDFLASGTNLMREYWNDVTDWASATPVEVAAGADVADIDAALAVGGAISGTVIRTSDGSSVSDVTVEALDAHGEIRAQTQSGVDGSYRIDGLSAGSYSVHFQIPSDSTLAGEYWENARTQAGGALVHVVPEQVVTGIDASLETVGHITGSVMRASDDSPLWSASVIVEDVESGAYAGSTWVQADGTFDLVIAPGTYTVRFSAGEAGVLDEYWKDAYTPDDATTVTVVADGTVSGLDAQLESAATISGEVTLVSDEDREVVVEAYDGDTLVASAHASLEDGSYTLYAPVGTYTLKASVIFYNGSTTTAKPQWFDGAKKQKKSTSVTVSADAPVSGIDFTLIAHTE